MIEFEDGITPLSAETFNKMQKDLNQGSYFRACIANDFVLTNTDITLMPFNVKNISSGNLSLSNGGIKIGKDIKAIEITLQVYWYQNLTFNDDKIIYVYKNNNQMLANNTRINDTYEHVTATTIIEVQEGDIIYAKVKGYANDLIKNYSNGTFLCVHKIA